MTKLLLVLGGYATWIVGMILLPLGLPLLVAHLVASGCLMAVAFALGLFLGWQLVKRVEAWTNPRLSHVPEPVEQWYCEPTSPHFD